MRPTFPVLADVMYRGLARCEAAWDLMALIVGAGLACTAYQAWHQVLGRPGVLKTTLVACVAALAVVLALLL